MIQHKKFHVAIKIIEKIEKAGFEAVIVGGAVRDYLLNKKINDVDIATNALPMEIKSIFTRTVDVGIEHGTILVLDEGEPIEVTTYRTDGAYEDFRRPGEVFFVRNLEEDLQRRDFTINAMAMTKEGRIIDLYDGKKDLQNQLIRAVGNPQQRFQEDALRMVRAVRFSAQLGFSIEQETLQAIQQDCHLIQHIAKERIQMEFSKMWTSPYVYNGIYNLIKSGLSQYLKGDFEKHLQSFKLFSTEKSEVGWAYLSLLNDCQYTEIVQFYKLSNKDKQFMKNVLEAYNALQKNWTPFHYFHFDLEVLEAAYDFFLWQNKQVSFKKEQIKSIKQSLPIKKKEDLALNGHSLLKWSNKKPGPWIKKVIDEALNLVLNNQVENTEEKLKEWFLNEFNDKG